MGLTTNLLDPGAQPGRRHPAPPHESTCPVRPVISDLGSAAAPVARSRRGGSMPVAASTGGRADGAARPAPAAHRRGPGGLPA
jgi:hypothetical protein